MSLAESAVTSAATAVDCAHHRTTGGATAVAAADHRRLSSKRKLDDYGGPNYTDEDDEGDFEYCDDHLEHDVVFSSDVVSVKMRRDQPNAVESSTDEAPSSSSFSAVAAAGASEQIDSRVSDAQTASFRRQSSRSPLALQFFIRTISGGKTLVIHADSRDTVRSLHERIQVITGIPVSEQRLIYGRKQLQWEQSLAECSIQNDASLQLVGRLRSTDHPNAWHVIDKMISAACRLCRGDFYPRALKDIQNSLTEYFEMIPKEENESATSHLRIFMSSMAPSALVMLYVSPLKINKDYGDSTIRLFLTLIPSSSPRLLLYHCAPILLEFCKLLRRIGTDDPLYIACRNSLGSLLDNMGFSGHLFDELIGITEIFPFVKELGIRLSVDLCSSMDSSKNSGGPSVSEVRDFTSFLTPLCAAVAQNVCQKGRVQVSSNGRICKSAAFNEEIQFLHRIFVDMLFRMDECLQKMEENIGEEPKGGDIGHTRWAHYLIILKDLNLISRIYEGTEEKFWIVLKLRKIPLRVLVNRYAKRCEDNQWILKHKEVLDFESRTHLAMMMFPEVKEDYEELHEMLIDRSKILEESYEYIAKAETEALHGGLFMEFKNEEATGPGVLREWFYLVCQALFNPQLSLFVACPNDCRRFYPNQASKIDPLHLDYYGFAGRLIALALMHKVQVGIVFDRVFFLQLAGKSSISLEDIRDTDPFLYSSCKKILQMDAELVDSDALGLTFVAEVEEIGSMRSVDLCPGGKNIIVNSRNRDEYVNLLIQHKFYKSISVLVSRFSQGFADMLHKSEFRTSFFKCLELEDLDLMLHGSETAISVEDWKKHTEYNGYKESDPQIVWFWKIVGEMAAEQRKILLFFWTSMKHLPVDGFRGLPSRLFIYRSSEPIDHLPSSHTCFYRLCFPEYPSKVVLRERLRIITQEHIGSSFGTW